MAEALAVLLDRGCQRPEFAQLAVVVETAELVAAAVGVAAAAGVAAAVVPAALHPVAMAGVRGELRCRRRRSCRREVPPRAVGR